LIPIRFIVLPLAAVAGVALAAYTVREQNKPVPAPPIPIAPNASPFIDRIAGIGSVEPSSEVVAVGAPIGALVESMLVREGDRIAAGQPLFVLDTREALVRLRSAEADLRVAEANRANILSLPRAEDLARAEARLAARAAAVVDAEGRLERLLVVGRDAVVTANERPTLEFQLAAARAAAAEAEADLAQIRRGSYPEVVEQAEAQVALAKAGVDEARTAFERLTVRSPIDATVLSVAIRQGEFASSGPQAPTLVAIGSLDPMHLRVEIDELDAWRFDPKAKAVAMLRGSEKREYRLSFVRVVPQVVPKRTLSGDMGERTDTRVMQVIYAVETDETAPPLLVGQALDVFIDRGEARSASASASASAVR
jgi:multidrug efflux pump subunit AcrA (membrane-fusion protein)